MGLDSRFEFVRDRIVSRRWFQVSAFVLVLALSLFLLVYGRAHLDFEHFLRYGYLGVFAVSLSCVTILFPLPFEAVVVAAGAALDPFWVGIAASVGSTIGELSSYLVGFLGRKVAWGQYVAKYERAESWLNRYGFLAVFLFALLPVLVFDVLGIVAGSFRFPLWKFILACWIGKVIRSLAEAYFGWGASGIVPSLW